MNSDRTAHLMHELTVVNAQLVRYVLRLLDAEAGQPEPVSVADELALADSVTTVAEGIRARAEQRQRQSEADTATTEEM